MKLRQIIILGIAGLVLIGSVGVSKFLAGQKEEPEERKIPVTKKYVATERVEYSDIKTDVQAYGRVQSSHTLDLLSEVSGRMYESRIRLKEGVNFKKGNLIFYIDDTEASLNLKSQKSNFLRDIAAILPDLKLDYSDNYELWSNYFSSIEIDGKLPELPKIISQKEKTFIATKGIFSSFYSIKSAEERLRKHKFYAPWDGSISQINLETGAFVNPGVAIGKIMRSGAYELKVAVETRDIPWIERGTEAGVISEETQLTWNGSVSRISDYVNQNTQSVDVFITIEGITKAIYDGQFLKASIPARVVKNGMEMPRNAIFNGNEVFVLRDSFLTVEKVDIFRLNEESAIVGGLENGDDLVIEPLLNAYNNMKAYKLDQREIELKRANDGTLRSTTTAAN